MTTLGYGAPLVTYQGAQVVGNVQQVLGRTSNLTTRENIAVAMEEGTVVLRGIVPSERERRLAEGVVRLTPGVRTVRNEILVK
jgi:osmotically-inducible protein OsmY